MGRTVRRRSTTFKRTPSDISQTRHALQSIEIRRSRIHGRGLFARRDIPAGSRLIQYVGRRIPKHESAELCLKQNAYIFTLNEQDDVDGRVSWNPARLINHSCEPNCDAELDDRDRIWIVSRRAIQRGEELTYNYGYDLKDFRNYPCRCGASSCLGYMVAEDLFPAVRRLLSVHEV
jgi:SET domain-containing protein